MYLEGANADRITTLVETLHATLKELFRAQPRERLRVVVLADRPRFIRTLRLDGFCVPDNIRYSGCFSRSNNTVYECADGDPDVLRSSLLWQCTEQFHYVVSSDANGYQNRSRYYSEGLDQHFARVRGDSGTPRIGVLPEVETTDIPAAAMADFQTNHHRSFRLLATDPTSQDARTFNPGGAWGLVSFLIDAHQRQYTDWSRSLDSGMDPVAAFDRVFGTNSDQALSVEYLNWLQAHQEPFETAGDAEWITIGGDAISCWAPGERSGRIVHKQPTNSLAATVTLTGSDADCGIVVMRRTPPSELQQVIILPTGEAQLQRWSEGQGWAANQVLSMVQPLAQQRFQICAQRAGSWVSVFVNGCCLYRFRSTADELMGFEAGSGKAVFSSIQAGSPTDVVPPSQHAATQRSRGPDPVSQPASRPS